MIVFKHHGSFDKTERFLKKANRPQYIRILSKYAKAGVDALASATPSDSGETANAWGYEIRTSGSYFSIRFTNSNVVDGVPIAIILQYGHATRNGGYVEGRDYINPAVKPILDRLAEEAWKEVTNL